jgi:hypothetical protein
MVNRRRLPAPQGARFSRGQRNPFDFLAGTTGNGRAGLFSTFQRARKLVSTHPEVNRIKSHAMPGFASLNRL